jgi:oxygen-independent coproporphyrinogen III oxidase
MYGVYIHTPWCRRHCPYCAFNVYVEQDPPFKEWKEAVLRDWIWNEKYFPNKPSTLYFGGGTPSVIPPELIGELIDAINPGAIEITLEANPEDITAARLIEYQQCGVNRLSLGVQSFNSRFEKILGRGSSIHKAKEAIRLVQESNFRSWSFDLMFALPNQSLSEVTEDLVEILKVRPPHVSLYGLTYELGTPFRRALEKSALEEVPEDNWLKMFNEISSVLIKDGYERYEVSNFSLPNHRSIHNEAIWRNGHYAGLGPGAHGFLPNGDRTIQSKLWEQWISSTDPIIDHPTAEQQAIDAILTWIRHCDGISLTELGKFGYRLSYNRVQPLLSGAFLKQNGDRIILASKGVSVVDLITTQLVEDLTPIE